MITLVGVGGAAGAVVVSMGPITVSACIRFSLSRNGSRQ
ncbi:hypothetical protein TOK_2350 [Pseudonocardia sp. N23]|nr:hypothetical protein TOK_2350 [Pseudonocardia sp. N23]